MPFPPEHTFDLQATDRDSAIREFLRCLARVGAIPSHGEEQLFAAFHAREDIITTGVGYGIAVPHVVSDLVTKRVIALGRLRSGVEFSSLDGRPVHTVALMILPKSLEATPNA